jgi:uncharacterized membrane protein YsdA (DUF1294 family)
MLFSTFVFYAIFINAMTFAFFGEDKRRAGLGEWRIPEARLLFLASIGGWPGAKLGQRRFRHKTRKQPFATLLNGIGFVQAGLVLIVLSAPHLDLGGASFPQSDLLEAARPEPPSRMPHRFGPGSGD